jgi:hypothetical protein
MLTATSRTAAIGDLRLREAVALQVSGCAHPRRPALMLTSRTRVFS